MVVHVQHQVLAHHRQPNQTDIASSFCHFNLLRRIIDAHSAHRVVTGYELSKPGYECLFYHTERKLG